jgi:hypothetical protein
MRYERPKYMKALQEKKQQADMEYQLSKLQERLHDEQRRNAELKKDRLSTSSNDSQLYAETNGTRSRGRSAAHMWMADADGIISQLNEEAGRLRKENEEQRALTAQLKSEVEKLKFDQTVLTANFQVKIRGFQDTVGLVLCFSLCVLLLILVVDSLPRFERKTRNLRLWSVSA